jgi:hypothetical protein
MEVFFLKKNFFNMSKSLQQNDKQVCFAFLTFSFLNRSIELK